MDRINAAKLVREIRQNRQYWLPRTKEDKKILEDLYWKLDIDKVKTLSSDDTTELLRIYGLMKEATK